MDPTWPDLTRLADLCDLMIQCAPVGQNGLDWLAVDLDMTCCDPTWLDNLIWHAFTWCDLSWPSVTWVDPTWNNLSQYDPDSAKQDPLRADLTCCDPSWPNVCQFGQTSPDKLDPGTDLTLYWPWPDLFWPKVTWLDLMWTDMTWMDPTWLFLPLCDPSFQHARPDKTWAHLS